MTTAEPLIWRWLGRVPYREAHEQQRAHRDAIIGGHAREEIWLLEHDPVVTYGRRSGSLRVPEEALAARGIDLVLTERGGLATWHGPGQLVAYLLVDLPRRGWGVRGFVEAMEGVLIELLGDHGVRAARRPGAPGVWVGPAKIAALGLHVRRGVTMHGLALNVRVDPSGFELIVPCGLDGLDVTDLERELLAQRSAPPPTLRALAHDLGARLSRTLHAPGSGAKVSP